MSFFNVKTHIWHIPRKNKQNVTWDQLKGNTNELMAVSLVSDKKQSNVPHLLENTLVIYPLGRPFTPI